MKKIKIDVKPVSWKGREALKWQATATLTEKGDGICRIFGDPSGSEYDAIVALKKQCSLYEFLARDGNFKCNEVLKNIQ